MDPWKWFFMGAMVVLIAVPVCLEIRRFLDRPSDSKGQYKESYHSDPVDWSSFLHRLKRIFRPKKHHRRRRPGSCSRSGSR